MGTFILLVGSLLIVAGLAGGGAVTRSVPMPRMAGATRLKVLGIGVVLIFLVLASRARSHGEPPAARGVTRAELDSLFGRPDGPDSVPGPDSVGFRGFQGRALLRWRTGSTTTSVGDVTLDGARGSILVSHGEDQARRHVLQDIRLEESENGWSYVGSNLRDPTTGVSMEGFEPNRFYVRPTGFGNWGFDRACGAARCFRVSVELIP